MKHGASAQEIVDVLQQASNGVYRARGNFSDRDLDIAFLAKSLDGP